jgi:uncharacterized protein
MERTYLDAAPVIYAVEQVAPYVTNIRARVSKPNVVRVASELTRLECRVLPLRQGNTVLLDDFEDYFTHNVHELLPLTRAVMDRAAEIRAQYGFKTPDAMHLAAVESGCDVFLTNDHRLDRFPGIPVERP